MTKAQRSAAAKKGWRNRRASNPTHPKPSARLINLLSLLPIQWKYSTYTSSQKAGFPSDKTENVTGTYKGKKVVYSGARTAWGATYRIYYPSGYTAGKRNLSTAKNLRDLIKNFKG